MECPICLQCYESSGVYIPVMMGCCGNSICKPCSQNVRFARCRFCRSAVTSRPVLNRALVSLLKATSEGTAKFSQVHVRDMDEQEIADIEESEEKDCMEYVKRSALPDSQLMKKRVVLQKGTYALAMFNKNIVHMSYLSCTLKIGSVDMRFDLRFAGEMHKAVLIQVENKPALLQVDMECMHILKALAGIKNVGKVKYGFILKQIS
eukprot:TRINITY_DN3399_c0_g1_i3.p1 TRINITY_DN3399_c0_g1~~TRINITY_DN3399_c0_g1_i3.p1  ORF type:complete len:206 (-),score=44.04 TRINITY_DN3399_c0_g1_i3:41-658(-)